MDMSEAKQLNAGETRKLASIQRIAEICAIDGADKIEHARINGWWVVTAKDNGFGVGNLVVYIEPDAWVPTVIAPFLTKGKEPREYNGVKGERLRTIKLRGKLSQGLILPIHPDLDKSRFTEGQDVTEFYGIQKWERPIPAQLQGQMRGNFPEFLRKTDQERVQNLPELFTDENLADLYEATLKLDGSSMTVWFNGDEWGVCSRNIDLKLNQEGNTFVDTAKKVFHEDKRHIIQMLGNVAFQGELMGEGIQGNRENIKGHEFFVFDIWLIDERRYMDPFERAVICKRLELKHVPLLAIMQLGGFGASIDEILSLADNLPSLNNPVAEGVVFKRCDGEMSMKAISNKFLLGEE